MAKNYREIAKKFGRNFRNPNLLKDGAASFESWRQRRTLNASGATATTAANAAPVGEALEQRRPIEEPLRPWMVDPLDQTYWLPEEHRRGRIETKIHRKRCAHAIDKEAARAYFLRMCTEKGHDVNTCTSCIHHLY